MTTHTPRPADALVVFGITGDLAKKMTLRSLYRLEKRGLLNVPVIGVAVDDWSVDKLRDHARESIAADGEKVDDAVFSKFAARLSYVSGDFADKGTYERLRDALKDTPFPTFYLEIPPSLFETVISGLSDAKLVAHDERIVVEKPFGHDLDSAQQLARDLHRYVKESQIYRIDHFLGKMGLEEIIYVRFANTTFEPVWNRNHVAAVLITMAETVGVEDRGHFYDPVGALRDVVVNHLMQVLASAAMEPPAGGDPDTIKDAKYAVFRSMRHADPKHYVRGQYNGYLDIDGVSPASTTETFAALRLEIDNWRWAGVPWYIRTGKCLPVRQTELRLVFKDPPRLGFLPGGHRRPEPSQIAFRIDPITGIRLVIEAHRADADGPASIELDMEFRDEGGEDPTPYEVLLDDALRGNSLHFTRQDSVDACWRVMQPLLNEPGPVLPYAPGTWGPEAAEELPRPGGGWRQPWLAKGL